MLKASGTADSGEERVALKDEKLVYRACSMAFAQSLGMSSPREVIGKTDFDLFPGHVARQQVSLDSRALTSAEADISAITLGSMGNQAVIVRTPVVSADQQVRGIDIRLLGGPTVNKLRSAVTIDYQTLVNDGIQGSLIFSDDGILFANLNAARVLGFSDARTITEQGLVKELFSEVELARISQRANRQSDESSATEDGATQRLTLTAMSLTGEPVRLISRVAYVQWGSARATLLSFVDIAMPPGMPASRPASDERGSDTTTAAAGVAPLPENDAANAPVNQSRLNQAAARTDRTPLVPSDLQKLRVSEQRFRHYARAAADFFWELDEKLMFRFVSEDLERVLGIPRHHLVGRTHRQLIDHPANINDVNHWNEQLERLNGHKQFRDFEFRWSVDGETRVIRYSGIPVFNRAREFLGYRGIGGDVTAAVRQAETTAYHANHDTLTGLFNRRHFEKTVATALEKVRRGTVRQSHALCFMDLDSFKIINDTCGHQAGDELLRQLGQLFDSLVRKSDVLGRLGGDEFGVFLYNCGVPEALKLANQVRHEVENFQFLWEENRFTVGVSVGLVVVDDRWDNLDALFSAADSACYIAKNEGRNRVVVYREGEGNASNRKVATHWVEEINSALADDRLHLACQRIQPLKANPELEALDGDRCEMFLRLEMPDGELVNPKSFLPSAERYGLTAELDARAVELAIRWLKGRAGGHRGIRQVTLNLSSGSFTDIAFREKLIQMILLSGIEASKFCFELTETATIANLAKASDFMKALATVGVRFSIDDFGSGLSSFAYLRKLPVDYVKIDGLLVKDILDDATDFTMVRSINEIAKSMNKRTVAEFVESPKLLAAVREIGIDYAQGYQVGMPELVSV